MKFKIILAVLVLFYFVLSGCSILDDKKDKMDATYSEKEQAVHLEKKDIFIKYNCGKKNFFTNYFGRIPDKDTKEKAIIKFAIMHRFDPEMCVEIDSCFVKDNINGHTCGNKESTKKINSTVDSPLPKSIPQINTIHLLDRETIIVGEIFAFRMSVSDEDANMDKIIINWGDNTPETIVDLKLNTRVSISWRTLKVRHTYSRAGKFVVKISIYDLDGHTTEQTKNLTIEQK